MPRHVNEVSLLSVSQSDALLLNVFRIHDRCQFSRLQTENHYFQPCSTGHIFFPLGSPDRWLTQVLSIFTPIMRYRRPPKLFMKHGHKCKPKQASFQQGGPTVLNSTFPQFYYWDIHLRLYIFIFISCFCFNSTYSLHEHKIQYNRPINQRPLIALQPFEPGTFDGQKMCKKRNQNKTPPRKNGSKKAAATAVLLFRSKNSADPKSKQNHRLGIKWKYDTRQSDKLPT